MAKKGATISVSDCDKIMKLINADHHFKTVEYFVDNEINANHFIKWTIEYFVKNEIDSYFIRWAIKNDHIEIIKYFIENEVDVKYFVKWVVKIGNLDIIEYLANKYIDMSNIYHNIIKLVTIYNNMYNNINIAKYLIKNKVKINTNNDNIIKWAIKNAHINIVKYLMVNY